MFNRKHIDSIRVHFSSNRYVRWSRNKGPFGTQPSRSQDEWDFKRAYDSDTDFRVEPKASYRIIEFFPVMMEFWFDIQMFFLDPIRPRRGLVFHGV